MLKSLQPGQGGIILRIRFPNNYMSQIRSIASAFLLLVALLGQSLVAAPYQGQHATAELIADTATVVPGQSFHIGLKMDLEEHWHVYWKNPGASGLPPEISWTLPEGFEVGELQFPAPERYELGGLVSYAHEGSPLFFLEARAPDELEVGSSITIGAEAFWLICKDVCIADESSFSLELEVGSVKTPVNSALFGLALAAQAQPIKALSLFGADRDGFLDLALNGLELSESEADLYFYAQPEGLLDPNANQVLSDDRARLSIPLAETFSGELPQSLRGILAVGDENFLVEVATVRAPEAVPAENFEASSRKTEESAGFEKRLLSFGFGGWLILAFIGGLILNIMPCVLPVLSLKVFSLLKHTGQSRSQALSHGLAYAAGVVSSFVALAAVLFALRAAGELIGWGYQLQSPGFTLGLGVLFFVFGLNLLGVFEIGVGLVGADSKVSQRSDLFGSFGMGVLAAVVGAPCMGPLVASVSGLALQVSAAKGLVVFGTMGLGLASPFLLLAVFPKLVAFLPKPGVWMETFKQFMGFLLMLAVIFIASVIGNSGGVSAIVVMLLVLFLAGLAAWIYGRWAAPVKPARTRRIASVIAAVLLIGSLVFGVGAVGQAYEAATSKIKADGPWATWSPERVEQELEAGNAVFVDFTATWCLICQANKLAMRSEETTALFEANGVVSLEADWTLRDPVIAKVLQDYDRAGVPLYLLYSPDGRVTELPQNLTNGIIRDAVEKHLN